MVNYKELIKESSEYAKQYIKKHESIDNLRFHNIAHTLEVVKAAETIVDYYKLNERDQAIVIIAAYFHDTGYCLKGHMHHEGRSADLAESFLRERDVDPVMIDAVKGCIKATQVPQSPKSFLEEIVCDADLFHLGSDGFRVRDKLMRKEAKSNGNEMDKNDWRKATIQFMENHHYFTEYGQQFLDKKKQKNLESLINKNKNGE